MSWCKIGRMFANLISRYLKGIRRPSSAGAAADPAAAPDSPEALRSARQGLRDVLAALREARAHCSHVRQMVETGAGDDSEFAAATGKVTAARLLKRRAASKHAERVAKFMLAARRVRRKQRESGADLPLRDSVQFAAFLRAAEKVDTALKTHIAAVAASLR